MHYSPVSPILDNILHHKNNTSNIRKTSPKQISDYLLNPLRRSYKFSYILIIPKTFAIELSKIMIRQIGAKYLINTLYSFFLRNGEDCSISFSIPSIPTTRRIRIQVASAANGIITEFVIKSKKSRKFIPKIRMKSRSPYPHGRCGSKYNHDHNHQTAAFLTAPVKFVHECGNTGFHQGNCTCQSCK